MQSLFDAMSAGVPALSSVQLQCLLPRTSRVPGITKRDVDLGKVIERVCLVVGVAEVAEQSKGVTVVVQGACLVTAAMIQISQAGRGRCLAQDVAVLMKQGNRLQQKGTGLVVPTQPCRGQTD